jgi:Protein of unknown function (DUF4230)
MLRFTIRQIVFVSIVVIALMAGFWFFAKTKLFPARQAENTTIMLEKIKTVTKLISVEGQFSELYDYKETYDYDFFDLFSKKILLRVTAKVSVGYDFEKVNISIDSISKTVTLNELPHAEILSIDHNLDYYDITQGTFNKFTTQEYNMINKKAKDYIATKANNAELLATAEKQKMEYIKMMEMALQSAGWSLVIKVHKEYLN